MSGPKAQRVGQIIAGALVAVAAVVMPGAASAQTTTTSSGPPAAVEQKLYGTSQWGSFPIENPAGSTRPDFDDIYSSMTGQLARRSTNNWAWGTLQRTSLTSIHNAGLELRFAIAGWEDDDILVEYSVDNWATARPLASYGPTNRPPENLATVAMSDLQHVISTPAMANQVQVRIRAEKNRAADTIALKIDQIRLVVRGS